MPENKHLNKVRVVGSTGMDGLLGWMNPAVAMTTNNGKILSLDSGNYTVVLGFGSGSYQQRMNPEFLSVTTIHATGYGWPTGSDCVTAGRTGVFPNGVPLAAIGTGMVFMNGNGTPFTFGR